MATLAPESINSTYIGLLAALMLLEGPLNTSVRYSGLLFVEPTARGHDAALHTAHAACQCPQFTVEA